MRILVALANYGVPKNDHVHRLIETYRGFDRHEVDIVILSNIPKDFGPDIEVRVGLPSGNPWSLPFAHRPLFAERQDDYDLFIYSEDDTLILERHVDAFLAAEAVLPPDHIAGFMRHEIDETGAWHYSTVHAAYHWDPASVIEAGGEVYASFTNEHSAAYILTREKLKRCIASGGFLIGPHEGRYDMLCSAATDPYTRCGLHKVVNVSRLEDFSLHHLPNKYIGRIGLPKAEMDLQLARLRQVPGRPSLRASLLDGRVRRVASGRYDRSYFTPQVPSVVRAMPDGETRVLSIGCDMGRIEADLIAAGHVVEAVPLDHVIAASARHRGVEILDVDLDSPAEALAPGRYDVLLMNFCLPYLPDPVKTLQAYAPALAPGGAVLVPFWNWSAIPERRRRREEAEKNGPSELGDFAATGIHRTDARVVRGWLEAAGFRVRATEYDVPARHARIARATLHLFDRLIAVTGTIRAGQG